VRVPNCSWCGVPVSGSLLNGADRPCLNRSIGAGCRAERPRVSACRCFFWSPAATTQRIAGHLIVSALAQPRWCPEQRQEAPPSCCQRHLRIEPADLNLEQCARVIRRKVFGSLRQPQREAHREARCINWFLVRRRTISRSIGVACIRIDLRQMKVGWTDLSVRQGIRVRRGLDVSVRYGSQSAWLGWDSRHRHS
jgi:hypothetical protein